MVCSYAVDISPDTEYRQEWNELAETAWKDCISRGC